MRPQGFKAVKKSIEVWASEMSSSTVRRSSAGPDIRPRFDIEEVLCLPY